MSHDAKLTTWGFISPLASLHSKNRVRYENMTEKKDQSAQKAQDAPATPAGFVEAKMGDVVKLENPGDSLRGTFIELRPSNVYKDSWGFKVSQGDENKLVFVNSIVKDLVEANDVEKGDEVILSYEGMHRTADGKKEYKTYKLLVRRQ